MAPDNDSNEWPSLFDCSLSFLTDEMCRLADDDESAALENPFLFIPFWEHDGRDDARDAAPGHMQPSSHSNETRMKKSDIPVQLLQQRGQKIDDLGEKANKLNESAATYASLAKQLKEKMQDKQKKSFFARVR